MKLLWPHFPFYLICFIGFLIQVKNISLDYFSYATITKITIDFPEYVPPPSVSVCSRLGELVNISEAKRLHNIEFNGSNARFHYEVFPNLTLSQLFELVPKPNQTLVGCKLREPGEYFINNETKCDKYFNISRYYMQEYICFKYDFKMSGLYDFESVSQADSARGRVYNLQLDNELFKRVIFFTIIVHSRLLPYESRYYSARIFRKTFGNESYSTQSNYMFSFSERVDIRLPYPYDTGCGFNQGRIQSICKQMCLTENVMRTFNKIPFNWIIAESNISYLDKKIMVNSDFYNTTAQRIFNEIEENCRHRCNIPECASFHFNTQLLDIDYKKDDVINIHVLLPLQPSVRVVFMAEFSTTDYIVFIMSCLGTWLGVSMVHLDPVKLVRQRMQQKWVFKRKWLVAPVAVHTLRAMPTRHPSLHGTPVATRMPCYNLR